MHKSRCWTPAEDAKLISLMQTFSTNKWCVISQSMGSRSPVQCMNRWTKILKPGLLKGYWSKDEDEQLLEWIKVNGPKKWSECAKYMKKRSAKQCRERWLNHLDPSIRKEDWTPEEDQEIYQLYKKYGTSWSKLAREMKGRTENAIKNRFYSSIRSLIANENGTENYSRKEKKKVNKNQGFFNVLRENCEGEAKSTIEGIKRKMLSHSSGRDPIQRKKRNPEDFYDNLYGKNFEDGGKEAENEEKQEKPEQLNSILPEEKKNATLSNTSLLVDERKTQRPKEEEESKTPCQDTVKKLTSRSPQESFLKAGNDNGFQMEGERRGEMNEDPLFREFTQFKETMMMQQFEAFKAFMMAGNPFFNFQGYNSLNN